MAFKTTRDLLQRVWHWFKPQGPYERFAKLYKKILKPRVEEAFNSGERICHFIILSKEEKFNWDDLFPPKLKHECTTVLYDNEIYSFFQDEENVPFAKKYLLQKKFGKIDCGYEAFPIEVRENDPFSVQTVLYKYVRRPFIHLSSIQEGAGARQTLVYALGPAFISD